ncbi:hypothetical protein [Roseinatronobacter alkalisoli]|uniref:Flagellar biosynthesis protein n=1 Tax=Roseinatronobacter alkalisoli TaxID=3028235 RepID=A0ABT5T9B0_9RHOB|nr:hypothetical protein [Roseinatronobacter sp. HJB301]MDD7970757.1 hypothetical protein [Roseinatronobacter sp. HJB301]
MRNAMLKLEVFETSSPDAEPVLNAAAAEELRETAYEQGYGAGWQDALEQIRDEDTQRRNAALEALQAISFTYNEAHSTLEQSFLTLTQAVLERLVPEALRLSLPGLVLDSMQQMITRDTRTALQILCAPGMRAVLEDVTTAVPGLEAEILEEPSYSEAQISLRVQDYQRNIDLDAILAQLHAAFDQQVTAREQKEA